MSRQNLPAQGVPTHAAVNPLSREARVIAAVLFFAGALYVCYSGFSNTGLVPWLNERQAAASGGYYAPKLTALAGVALIISVAAGVARLFDFVTGRGGRGVVKK